MVAPSDRKDRAGRHYPEGEVQGDLLSETDAPTRGEDGSPAAREDEGAPDEAASTDEGRAAAGHAGPTTGDENRVTGEAEAPVGKGGAAGTVEGGGATEGEEARATEPGAERRSEADRELRRARALVADGQAEAATEIYRELVRHHPRHVSARNDLGVLFHEMGHPELALEQFQAARDMEPENVEVLANLGTALGELGRFDDAERELKRAQRLDPDSIDVRARLGILYFRRGLYAQAETELRWVCIRDTAHGPAHFYRGEALNRLGRVDDAMEALERAAHLQPGNARTFYTLGILFDKKHMPQEAARMYRRARELGRP